MTLKIAIAGAGGRMGRQLIQAVHNAEGAELGAAFERKGSSLVGADAGELAGIGALGIKVSDDLNAEKDNFDLLIDFTRPEGTLEHIAFCVANNKKMVIGTTGFDDAGKAAIQAASEKIAIVFASNFSVGVNLVFKLLEKAENTLYKPIKNNANFLMGRKFLLKESQKYENRGKSIFEGKVDNFDAYDEIWSQWMLSVRKGQIKEYIPEDLLPRDLKTGVMKRKSDFENEFILLSSTMGEGDKNNLIQTTQGTIQHEGLLTSYITALDQCLTGLISPSTLGIDTKKLDNAEASREKEKTTLYKRSQIVDSMRKLIEDIVNITFKFYDNLNGKKITDTKCEVVFTEYANPSFEAQVETIGKANTAGIMSIEATVEQLWGDNKKEDWIKQEIKRLKNEKGIMEEVEPAVNKDNIDIIEEEQKNR